MWININAPLLSHFPHPEGLYFGVGMFLKLKCKTPTIYIYILLLLSRGLFVFLYIFWAQVAEKDVAKMS